LFIYLLLFLKIFPSLAQGEEFCLFILHLLKVKNFVYLLFFLKFFLSLAQGEEFCLFISQ